MDETEKGKSFRNHSFAKVGALKDLDETYKYFLAYEIIDQDDKCEDRAEREREINEFLGRRAYPTAGDFQERWFHGKRGFDLWKGLPEFHQDTRKEIQKRAVYHQLEALVTVDETGRQKVVNTIHPTVHPDNNFAEVKEESGIKREPGTKHDHAIKEEHQIKQQHEIKTERKD